MTNLEGSEGRDPSEHHRPPIEIGITPDEPESAVFRKSPDGTYTIFLRGEIRLVIHPTAISQVPESPVPDAETPSNGLLPDSTSQPLREPHSAADKESPNHPEHRVPEKPKDEDNEYVFTGTLTGEPRRPKRRDGKKVVQFDLAMPTETGERDVKQVRVFRELAAHTWHQIQAGETYFHVRAFGRKYWPEWQKDEKGKLRPTGEYTAGYYAYVVNGVSNKSLAARERKARGEK